MGTGVCVSLTPFMLNLLPSNWGTLSPLPSIPRAQRTPGRRPHVPVLPPHPAVRPAASVTCPCTGGSHSRSKEILCKSTGSQRRQDSGQAWQRVCVNASEQADFAQRG